MKTIITFFLYFFLFLHASCHATKYDHLIEEIRSKVAPHLARKTAAEYYKMGVSLRKGETVFENSKEDFPLNSLSCLLAQRICFESVLREPSTTSDLSSRAFHNLGMISLQLYEVENAIKWFEKSTLKASKENLEKIRKIEKDYNLCGAVGTYKDEIIFRFLISNNVINTVNITENEAELFKFKDAELEDIFKVAGQVLNSIKKDQGAILLSVGRSPFWITAAIKSLSLPKSLRVISLSFSQSRRDDLQANEYSSPQVREYLKYLREKLAGVSSTDTLYVLDYCDSGLTAIEIWRMLDACYPPLPERPGVGGLESSTFKNRIHLIALRNSTISLPYDRIVSSQLAKIYSSVTNIELPSSLKLFLVQKDPFYTFLEMPYLGFYPSDWESYQVKGEPSKTIKVVSPIPTVRLKQIDSFKDKMER